MGLPWLLCLCGLLAHARRAGRNQTSIHQDTSDHHETISKGGPDHSVQTDHWTTKGSTWISWLVPTQSSRRTGHHNSQQAKVSRRKSVAYQCHDRPCHMETLLWAVKLSVPDGYFTKAQMDRLANRVASSVNLVNKGQIGHLFSHYLFSHPFHEVYHDKRKYRSSQKFTKRKLLYHNLKERKFWEVKAAIQRALDQHVDIEWYSQQLVHQRKKRLVPTSQEPGLRRKREQRLQPSSRWKGKRAQPEQRQQRQAWEPDHQQPATSKSRLTFNDPQLFAQWHLRNTVEMGMDINVTGVWERNITGQGITVVVVDDGVEYTNPDLQANYSPEGSWDFNDDDPDPMPKGDKAENHHGTRCAGEIGASANNNYCGVGVAYGARVAGIRVLDGPLTDSLEAAAFTKNMEVNDVYSCSWGPDDDGKTVDGPQHLALKALQHGVDYGRHGYGSIYVVASGNGGKVKDNCNFDGYANSIYTITIGAVDETGSMPYYAEECASMLAVTFSSGDAYQRRIVTADWRKDGGTGCTDNHTGTSAAAPLAAAMVALMLQARPCITWRDTQWIIVLTATKVDKHVADWSRNGAGLFHSHKHGFGLMNAWRIVNAAKVWETVPWLTLYATHTIIENRPFGSWGNRLTTSLDVSKEQLDGFNLYLLEYVHVVVTLTHPRRGDVEIRLRSPAGTESILATPRPNDSSTTGFQRWTFSTVRCWGEQPQGRWLLTVMDTGRAGNLRRGTLIAWQLKLYGTAITQEEFRQRQRMVWNAIERRVVDNNVSRPCPPPSVKTEYHPPISERVLKVLVLVGLFCLVMGVYETMEYMMCYAEEKEEQRQLLLSRQPETEPAYDDAEDTRLLQAARPGATETSTEAIRLQAVPNRTYTHQSCSDNPAFDTQTERELLVQQVISDCDTSMHHAAINSAIMGLQPVCDTEACGLLDGDPVADSGVQPVLGAGTSEPATVLASSAQVVPLSRQGHNGYFQQASSSS